MPLLQLDNIMAYYGPIRALNDVSISIEAGEIVCLLGGNASGKSTTMKTILGVVRASAGSVRFAGERIDRPADAIDRRARYLAGARGAPAVRPHDGAREPHDGRVQPAP